MRLSINTVSRFLLSLAVIFVMAVLTFAGMSRAFSQTTSSQSASSSNGQAASQAGSLSGAQINQTFQGSPARQDFGYSGGTNNTTRVEGTQTLRNTPSIYAPSFGGTNPCTVSASGGGAVAGFGITLGGSWASPECERRNLAVIAIQALGDSALAHEILCGTEDFRTARARMGNPCAVDRPVVAPNVAAMAPPVEVVNYTPRSVPAWCDTVSPRDPAAARAACGR